MQEAEDEQHRQDQHRQSRGEVTVMNLIMISHDIIVKDRAPEVMKPREKSMCIEENLGVRICTVPTMPSHMLLK